MTSGARYNIIQFVLRQHRITQLVLIRVRVHPFPFRTRQLSSLLPTILGWRRPGKIGSANINWDHIIKMWSQFFYKWWPYQRS